MTEQRTPEERNMLDLTKPVQTRDGRKVRVLCSDAQFQGGVGIVGLMDDGGFQNVRTWYADGKYSKRDVPDDDDLINVPKKKVQVHLRLYRVNRMTTGLGARLGVVAILEGETFGPATPISSATVEMEYEELP